MGPPSNKRVKNINLDDVLKVAQGGLELAQNTGIPGIDHTFAVLIGLVKTIRAMRSNHEGFEDVAHEINDLVELVNTTISDVNSSIEKLGSHRDLQDNPVVQSIRRPLNLEKRLNEFTQTLEVLVEKANEYHSRPSWLRFVCSSQDAAALEELRAEIAACRKAFKLKCLIVIDASVQEGLKLLHSINKDVVEVKQLAVQEAANNSDDREERILDSLPRVEASYLASVNTMKGEFREGTRVELFHEINQWAKRRTPGLSDKAVCLLTGKRGTGKSTIASEFARRRSEKKDYGASFFFVRDADDLNSTRLVFQTLAHQLAHSQHALRPHIVCAAREYLKGGKDQRMAIQAQSLVHGPVHKVSSKHPPLFLVVDALDECAKDMDTLVPKMLDLLVESVGKARFPLRIFMTSCPNIVIESTLAAAQWAPLVHTISLDDLPQEYIARDMVAVTNARLRELPAGPGRASLEQVPDVAARLVARAEGQFVYTETALDFLHDYPRFVHDRVDSLLAGGSSTFAAKLGPLDDLYLTVLEVAFPPNSSSSRSSDQSESPAPESHDRKPLLLLRPTLGNLAVLRRPLSLLVLSRLTGVARADVCGVLRPIRAVVLCDEARPDAAVRVRHATFAEFLVDARRCMNRAYYDRARHHHARLAVRCLRALEADLEKNATVCRDRTKASAVPDLAQRAPVPEHMQYACMHWAAHLGNACEMKAKTWTPRSGRERCACWDIGAGLEAFTGTSSTGAGSESSKLRAWVEVMAYMGRLDAVAEALRVAQDHLKDILDYQEVKARLAETEKLVADHYSEIEECPYKVHEV